MTLVFEDEPIWELGDAVDALRSGDVVWNGLARERLLTAIEKALNAHRSGAVSTVALDARELLEVIRGDARRTLEAEVGEAAKAHTRSAIADPTRGGRAGSFLFGIVGVSNEITGTVDEILAEEIERAYVAGAALMQSTHLDN